MTHLRPPRQTSNRATDSEFCLSFHRLCRGLPWLALLACTDLEDPAGPVDTPDATTVVDASSAECDAAEGTSCASDAGPVGVIFTAAERAMFTTLSPLEDLPADTTNSFADHAGAATLGQKLFFDPGYSGALRVASDLGQVGESGKVSCASCHSGPMMDDQRSMPNAVSIGADRHSRNSPAIVNSAFYRWTNWGGRFSAPWELPPVVLENPAIMNSNRLRLAHYIFDHYRSEYEAVFGPLDAAIGNDPLRFPAAGKPKPAPTQADPNPADGAWEMMTAADRTVVNRILANFGKSLEAYSRKLVSRGAPFDLFVAGDDEAIDHDAKRGLQVFLGKGRCVSCHSGAHFTDGLFHNLGVPELGEKADEGRFSSIPPLLASPMNSAGAFSDDAMSGRLDGLVNPPPAETRGEFRTASLRGVAQTAPYMHAGQLATLEAVIEFYDQGGGGTPAVGVRSPLLAPLGLTPDEKRDLRAFLDTLTGEPVSDALRTANAVP